MRVLLAVSLGLALVSPGTAVATVGSLDFRDCVSSDAATTGCTNISATTSGLDALTHAVVVSPDGGSVYTAAESGDDVAHFSRDLATGTVTFKDCIAAGDAPATGCSDIGATTNVLNGPTAIVISRDGTDVYVAGGPGIAHLRRDALTGVLTFADCITSVPTTTGCGPVTPTTTAVGSLDTLKFGTDEHHLYAGGSGTVIHLTRSVVDGSLAFADCISGSAATGCTDISGKTNAFNTAESVAPSADGKNLYVAGDATVYNLTLDVAGVPAFGDCVTTRGATTGCTDLSATNAAFGALENVAISPDGGNVYLAAQGGGLSTMTRNATTGTLTFDSCIASFATAGCTDISATNGALTGLDAVTVSQDNRSVYTAGGAAAAHLTRTPGTGALTPADCLSLGAITGCTAVSASTSGFSDLQELTLSPGGESAYAASEDTDTLVHLRRQLAPTCTGAAIAVAHDAATPVALACHDANGDALTRAISAPPLNGTLGPIDQGAATVLYTPNPGFSGADLFSFTASDGRDTSDAATSSLTVGAATATKDTTAPVITKLSAKATRRKRGGTVRFTLSERAKVTVTIQRKRGRRFATVGSFKKTSAAGANRKAFGGKLAKRKLKPGRYRVRARATDAAGNRSKTRSASFRVKR